MNATNDCLESRADGREEPLTEEEELERDRQELHASHQELTEILARTRPAADRRRRAMVRLKDRWSWDNSRIAAEIGVEKGSVWKAVRVKPSTEEGEQALAS